MDLMNNYLRAWSSENSLEFYKNNRNKKKDLYDSEHHFISKILKPGIRILDIGCASGGFSNILKSFESNITYVGIDSSPELIKQAKIQYPGIDFCVSEADKLPFEDN